VQFFAILIAALAMSIVFSSGDVVRHWCGSQLSC
jgi:hypothetical protein